MLNTVYGSAGTGKTNLMYEMIAENIKKNIKSFILVPDQYSMYAESDMLKRLGMSAQSHVEVLSFSRLCMMIFDHIGPLRLKYIDSAGKYIIAQRCMQILEKKLNYLKSNVYQNGFAKIIVDTISEFKRYGVSPSDLEKSVSDEILSRKLADLKLIYEEYDRLIAEKHSNTEDNISIVCPKIKNCDFLSGAFFLNYFKSFTPLEYAVLSELMKKGDMTVFLCCDNLNAEKGLFASASLAYKNLKDIAEADGISVSAPTELNEELKFGDNPELLHLKNNYFSYSPKKYAEDVKHIHIIMPRNCYNEVRTTAKLISKLCRTKGYHYSDFLVLTRNIENYNRLIPAVFSHFGINFFSDEKKALTSNPFMRMILSLLEILSYGFSYERVMTIARSGFLNIDRETADKFENYILAANITHKYWNSAEDWIFNPDIHVFDMKTVNRGKQAVLNPILKLISSVKGRKTVTDISSALCKWLDDNNISKILEQKCDLFTKDGNLSTADLYRQVWNIFISLISQLNDCLGDDNITYAKYYDIFSSACSEITIGMIPPSLDQVIISEIDRFRNADAKVVIVLGLNEGVFPKGYSSEGFLSDAERKALGECGLELAPNAYKKGQEEQTLLYSVLTTASDELYLLCPLGDKEGKSLLPSEIITKISTKIFEKLPIIYIDDENSASDMECEREIFDNLIARLARVGNSFDLLSPMWKEIYTYFSDNDKYSEIMKKLANSFKISNAPEMLSPEMVAAIYKSPVKLSVSKLEKYNSCAYAYFLRYGLFAKKRQKVGFESNDMGSVLHEVLCNYLTELRDQNADYENIKISECKNRVKTIVRKCAKASDELLYETSSYYRYLTMKMERIASSTAWEIVKFYGQSKFRPYDFEISIGGKAPKFPAKKIHVKNGDAEVLGFIDRMDTAKINGKTYISIVDYKPSSRDIKRELVEEGLRFQPLVYANIASENLGSADTAAMLYMCMDDPCVESVTTVTDDEALSNAIHRKFAVDGLVLDDMNVTPALDREYGDKNGVHYIPTKKASLVSESDLKEYLDIADKKMYETADKILSGSIEINPKIEKYYNSCQYCEYDGVCQYKK